MDLSLFFGEANDAIARVYARLDNTARVDGPREAGLTLSGRVIGPFCQYANTLPAHVPLISKSGGKSLLAEAVVPDPCFWTPELPFQYRVQVELRRGSEVLETTERPLGIRRLGPRGRDLFLEGKRFVIRGVSIPSPSGGATEHERPNVARAQGGSNASPSGRGRDWGAGDRTLISQLQELHELATALYAANPSDELCEAASRQGVLLIAEVTGDPGVELVRLAQWAAVGIAVIDRGATVTAEVRAAAPNLLLAQRATDLNSAPLSIQPWAQLLVCDADIPQQFATDVKESELPILARRRLSQSSPLIQARVACDQLQADLAPLGDFAGYLV